MHPEELDLLAYLEGELDDPHRSEVAAHLKACGRCAQEVRAAAAGRDALRSAPELELAPGRLEHVLDELPVRAAKRPGLTGRLLPVAAALAAVAALAGGAFVIGTSDRGDDEAAGIAQDESIAGGGAETAPAASVESAAGDDSSGTSSPTLKRVEGSARDVANTLRRQGFAARVSGDRVIVRGARAGDVRKALEQLGPGPVRVVVRP
jgi:anti-sigma factor RsiW